MNKEDKKLINEMVESLKQSVADLTEQFEESVNFELNKLNEELDKTDTDKDLSNRHDMFTMSQPC